MASGVTVRNDSDEDTYRVRVKVATLVVNTGTNEVVRTVQEAETTRVVKPGESATLSLRLRTRKTGEDESLEVSTPDPADAYKKGSIRVWKRVAGADDEK